MFSFLFGNTGPARFCGPAFLVCFALATAAVTRPCPASAETLTDHQQTVAALADVKAAIAQLVRVDATYSDDSARYQRAAHRAMNALVGAGGDGFDARAGTPGDSMGALGHIDALLNRKATPVWVTPVHTAEANIRGAVAHLVDAARARGLMPYALAASRALTYLDVAVGRPNAAGVFGGLEGALANTVLGLPAGAHTQDACQPPASAPSYGTHGGYVAWIAVPASDGTHALTEPADTTSLTVHNGMIVLNTAASKLVEKACRKQADAAPQPQKDPPAETHASAQSTVPSAGGALPALYTKAQATQGKQIFLTKCVACHGTNLQGTAAPSVAGNDFLTTAKNDGWTVAVIRYLVFHVMPLNAPATLSPHDASNVMAFLLASNCYPAGKTPFPEKNQASFAKIKLGPVPGHPAGQNDKGVCPVD